MIYDQLIFDQMCHDHPNLTFAQNIINEINNSKKHKWLNYLQLLKIILNAITIVSILMFMVNFIAPIYNTTHMADVMISLIIIDVSYVLILNHYIAFKLVTKQQAQQLDDANTLISQAYPYYYTITIDQKTEYYLYTSNKCINLNNPIVLTATKNLLIVQDDSNETMILNQLYLDNNKNIAVTITPTKNNDFLTSFVSI